VCMCVCVHQRSDVTVMTMDFFIYRMGHKSLDINAFKSQILASSDLWPTLYMRLNIRTCISPYIKTYTREGWQSRIVSKLEHLLETILVEERN
jgi:hypothetical protein